MNLFRHGRVKTKMVDRQAKELYQQQLAAQAAWMRRGAAAGYSAAAAAAQHSGFAPSAHDTNAYQNYFLQNMFGGATNILGNGAKDMTAGISSPFRLPGQFANFNYQRPLPAHSPLAAHMKNSGSSSTPITAHMISNPYQYPGNYGLNPSYGAMNTNYIHANASASTAGQNQSPSSYVNQSNERFRHPFDQSQFGKEHTSHRQESARRQTGTVNGALNSSPGEGSNTLNLQQLQAAYSQAALNSKDASKGKTPVDNYAAYYASAAQAQSSSSGT